MSKVKATTCNTFLNQVMMESVRDKNFLRVCRKVVLLIRAVKRHGTVFYLKYAIYSSWAGAPGEIGVELSFCLNTQES